MNPAQTEEKKDTVELSKTEEKLLEQIQAQAKSPEKRKPSLIKFLTSTACGWGGW